MEDRMNQGDKRFDKMERQTNQIHDIVCGNGSDQIGIGEQMRSIQGEQQRQSTVVNDFIEQMRGRGWKSWQKVAAVLVVVAALANPAINLIGKMMGK
jgi:hypothetical protein